MGKILSATLLVALVFVTALLSECSYVNTNERAFAYNVDSGLPVTPDNNPEQPYGVMFNFGRNWRHFVVNSEVHNHTFAAGIDANGDEVAGNALTWDSREGVTMAQTFTIFGRVTDIWAFYRNFGASEHDYGHNAGIDDRIYEALLQAAGFVDARMGELTQNEEADDIRKNPAQFTTQLTEETATYMQLFGFTITDIIFPEMVRFIGGSNTIDAARGKLQAANSHINEKKADLRMAEGEADDKIAQAERKAVRIKSDATIEAEKLTAETGALAEQLRSMIKQLNSDVDAALYLKTVEVMGPLLEAGVIPEAYVTGESMFAKPFYGK